MYWCEVVSSLCLRCISVTLGCCGQGHLEKYLVFGCIWSTSPPQGQWLPRLCWLDWYHLCVSDVWVWPCDAVLRATGRGHGGPLCLCMACHAWGTCPSSISTTTRRDKVPAGWQWWVTLATLLTLHCFHITRETLLVNYIHYRWPVAHIVTW